MNYSTYDTRTLQEKEYDIRALNTIEFLLKTSIADYALEDTQNLYDQENQEILRALVFSRGLKEHRIVLAPDGFIRAFSKRFSSDLIHQIHNVLIGLQDLIDEQQEP